MIRSRALADRLLPKLIAEGAEAIVLAGSHARGVATDASDLDMVVVGVGPRYRLDVCERTLVAEAWATEEEHRHRFSDPGEVGHVIPGWREAVILHDPSGIAARLQHEASEWNWELLGENPTIWVVERIIGFAEEAEKLVAALDRSETFTAAVQRDLLALHLAPLLAVHRRLLYGTENVLWALVAEEMGSEWKEAQSTAFGTGADSFEQTCSAALRLFRIALDTVGALLDDRQSRVGEHALDAARRWS